MLSKKEEIQGVNEDDIVFKPVKGTSQELALDARTDQTLLCGTRGSMKSATQLNWFHMRVGIGYGRFWRGLIYDREFQNLNDLVAQAKKFFLPLGNCVITESTSGMKCRWDTGEELQFRNLKKLVDYNKIHGQEFPFIGPNELTNHPNLELYDLILSTNRSSFLPEKHTPKNKDGTYKTKDGKPLPPIPLKCIATCNPSGVGHHAVKSRFITPAPYGHVVKKNVNIFNPQTGKEEVYVKTQVAIFSSYRENPYLDPAYAAMLNSITDPNKRLAWEGGSWSITSGGAMDDLWLKNVHVIPRFKIPYNWNIKRCFDWGSSHPFAVLWIAESNGETVTLLNGKEMTFARGSCIVINEWYGCIDMETHKGLGLSAPDIARGVLAMEKDMLENGWIQSIPSPGSADNQIGSTLQRDVETIKKKMEDCGVFWTNSDKSAGSRVNGLQIMRDMLQSSITKEGEGLYFMQNCVCCIETIPILPRDPNNLEDIDTDSPDHLYDALRYGLVEGSNRIATTMKVTFSY